MLQLSQTLWLWRQHRGLTQAALAQRARIARPNLSAIELGKREATLGTLRALAAALDVQPGLLVDGIPPPLAQDARPASSRETMERIADAVAFGGDVADPGEQVVVGALRLLLGNRTSAIRRRWSRPRSSRRATSTAWVTLTSLYGRDALRSFADRIAERQWATPR